MKRMKNRGFTALEILLVSFIIALLSIMILPYLQKRGDQAKRQKAYADLVKLAEQEILARAEAGFFPRLQDLDNGVEYNVPIEEPNLEVPQAEWNKLLTASQRQTLAISGNWNGPYNTYNPPNNAIEVGILIATKPYLFRNPPGTGGPIFNITGTSGGTPDVDEDLHPIDPWDNPYIFFGTGRLGINPATEEDWDRCVIYSLGPDGIPGNNRDETLATNYLRDTEYLGELGSDDLVYEF